MSHPQTPEKSAPKMLTYGLLARFESAGELLHAAEKVRAAGYSRFDCHSPFPIHGMDKAMGLKRSPVGLIAGLGAFLVGGFALWLEWWTSAVDYPLVIAGKPLFSLPAFIPVAYALTILGGCFGAVFGMFALAKLPMPFHGLFYSDQFRKVTDNGFFVSIESADPKFNESLSANFLESIGGRDIEVVRGE